MHPVLLPNHLIANRWPTTGQQAARAQSASASRVERPGSFPDSGKTGKRIPTIPESGISPTGGGQCELTAEIRHGAVTVSPQKGLTVLLTIWQELARPRLVSAARYYLVFYPIGRARAARRQRAKAQKAKRR